MKIFICIFLITLCFAISGRVYAQETTKITKPYSVIILPFFDDLRYPYDNDLIRESLIRGFHRKGYDLLIDDFTWSIILDLDYCLSNISPLDADSISKSINVDLIVFGHHYYPFFQQSSPLLRFKIRNPVPIKVFDTRKKEIVLRERLVLIEKRGLIINYYTRQELGDYIVNRLQLLGYKL